MISHPRPLALLAVLLAGCASSASPGGGVAAPSTVVDLDGPAAAAAPAAPSSTETTLAADATSPDGDGSEVVDLAETEEKVHVLGSLTGQQEVMDALVAEQVTGGLGVLDGASGTTGFGGVGLGSGARPSGAVRSTPAPVVMVQVTASATGGLSLDQVHRTVTRGQARARACYDRALRDDPTAAGRIVLRVAVADDGRVTEARVGPSTMGNAQLEACLVTASLAWVFSRTPGGGPAVVNVPYTFAPAPAPSPAPSPP